MCQYEHSSVVGALQGATDGVRRGGTGSALMVPVGVPRLARLSRESR